MRELKLFFLPFFLLLTSCFGGGAEIPQDNFYRLADISTSVKEFDKISFEVLAVESLKSDTLHRERAILYSDANQPLHLRRYHYHHWTQVPNQLIQEHLISYLRKRAVAKRVMRYGEATQSDANITGRIKRFERVIKNNQTVVQVELELHMETMSSPRRYLQNEYLEEMTAKDASIHATVTALSLSLEKIYARFMTDVEQQGLL